MVRLFAALLSASLLLSMPVAARAALTTDEQYVLDALTASRALQDAQRINAESHYASTPGDYHLATWMREQLADAGFNATLETFTHDVPFSRELVLSSLVESKKKQAWRNFVLGETPIPQDHDGTRPDAGVPFNAWSGNGEVIANIVDAGHGMPADYASLAARHVDVRTRIVLVRYGREFRGLLAKRAQAHGAKGVIFFNDPNDPGGSMRGPAYPDGPYRPNGSVQRGALEEGQISIPTLPITATNAQRILQTVRNGISDRPYRLKVLMYVHHNVALWNTVGILPGKDPTHEIVLGAHRDAWVYGVTDNGSGVSILLDVARALGALYKTGWRPQYSIVIAGFDGEEIGEVGSQAYVREHFGALSSGCLAYINEDEATTGQLFAASAAAALEPMIVPLTQSVSDPSGESNVPLYYRWKRQPRGASVAGPGGGSDFEAFLYDAGIPVMDFGFYGTFGVYHSGFDDLPYAMQQADPGFNNHRGVARLVALAALRIASGRVGYAFSPYVSRMNAAVDALSSSSGGEDLSAVRAAIARFSVKAAAIDHRGGDGNAEIVIVHRLNKLFYGRNGYAPVAFPEISTALASRNKAEVSAATGRVAHELDEIGASLANATRR
ncbi:MAG TPA: M28 family peptidase [Candidatus Aquilonibacter sp.]|nr:M28 family peptidase [Candidatus Aquilonibacter sp.]